MSRHADDHFIKIDKLNKCMIHYGTWRSVLYWSDRLFFAGLMVLSEGQMSSGLSI